MPGVSIGLLIALVLTIGVEEIIFGVTMNSTQYGLAASAIWLGLIFGILMPFLANYFPGKETMD